MKTYKNFKRLLRKMLLATENDIRKTVETYAIQNGYEVIKEINYIVAKYPESSATPLVCSHYDTMRKGILDTTSLAFENDTFFTLDGKPLGGDDRCGVAIALSLMQAKAQASFAFFDLEECGADGSSDFIFMNPEIAKDATMFIGLDRRGATDAAVYSYESESLLKYLEKFGYKKANGTMTDVSNLEDTFPKATVNLSVGFRAEHTGKETASLQEAYRTFKNMITIIEELGCTIFNDLQSQNAFSHYRSYVPESYRPSSASPACERKSLFYDHYDDYDDDYYYFGKSEKKWERFDEGEETMIWMEDLVPCTNCSFYNPGNRTCNNKIYSNTFICPFQEDE